MILPLSTLIQPIMPVDRTGLVLDLPEAQAADPEPQKVFKVPLWA